MPVKKHTPATRSQIALSQVLTWAARKRERGEQVESDLRKALAVDEALAAKIRARSS